MTVKNISLSHGLVISAMTLCVAGARAPFAHADVKIVTKNVLTGLPVGKARQAAKPTNQTTTTYYKGAKIRTEYANLVLIDDADADKHYELETEARTYTVTSLRAFRRALNPGMPMWDFTPTATVAPGGKTKMILGKLARNYVWTARVDMKMKARETPKNAGANGFGTAPPQTPMLTLSMRGEQWSSEAIVLPDGSPYESESAMLANLTDRLPTLRPLAGKLDPVKGVALQSATTLIFGGMAAGAPEASLLSRPLTVTTQAVSLSEAPLPGSLFRVPAGYKQVERKPQRMATRRATARP